MHTETSSKSAGFQQLYCNEAIFAEFSVLHPVSFRQVLPFRPQDAALDDEGLVEAELAHLSSRNDATRTAVVEAYRRCGLFSEEEADQLKPVVDYFDIEFFELMGEVYANAGMFICALRWYHESIAELESRCPTLRSDCEGVYASVGYCLYAMGLFAEAIAWSKSCIGPRQTADMVSRTLIGYEAQRAGGALLATERSGNRTRYTASAMDLSGEAEAAARLKAMLKSFAPFQEIHLSWVGRDATAPAAGSEGYPFGVELDGGELIRHKMNLIFATCGQADALAAQGYHAEARRLLYEVAMVEPQADFVWERIKRLF